MHCIVPNPQIPEVHVSELWAVGTRTEAKMLDVARIPLSKIHRRNGLVIELYSEPAHWQCSTESP
jgi:hypothetical protein